MDTRTAVATIAVLLAPACVTPARTPLPAPLPLTTGGTPVPGRGVGAALELGDGLMGQELMRKELLTGTLLVGVADRANLSVAVYGGHEQDDPGGFQAAAKVRVGSPLGARSSTAVRLGLASIDRVEAPEQDESLLSLDLAVPTELLVNDPSDDTRFGVYAGPRLTYEDYRDEQVPEDGFTGLMPGLLGGLHLDFGAVDLFGEGTLAFRPETRRRDGVHDGGPIFLPTAGVVAHTGSPFPWDR